LLSRFLEINAAMMAPAADISAGSNFSINSVLVQSRAMSNCTLRLGTKKREARFFEFRGNQGMGRPILANVALQS
jgi:hypothetical protein